MKTACAALALTLAAFPALALRGQVLPFACLTSSVRSWLVLSASSSPARFTM